MSKIPPAGWEDPEAFEPEEVREVVVESDPEEGADQRPADEDDEDLDEDLED